MSGESNPTATMPAPIQFGSADTQDLSFNPNGLRSPSKSIPDNAHVIVVDDNEMEDAQDGPAQAQDQAPVFSTPAWPDQSEWLKSIHIDGVSDSSPVTEYGSARRNSAASSNLATVPEGRGSGSGGSHLEIVAPSQGPSNRHAGNPYAALLRVAEEISAQKRARGHVKMTNQIRKCIQEWSQNTLEKVPKGRKGKKAKATAVQPKQKKVKASAQPAKKRKVQAAVHPPLRNGGAGKVSLRDSEVNQQNIIAGGLITMGAEMIDTDEVPIYADGSFRIYSLIHPVTGDKVKVSAGGVGVVFPRGHERDFGEAVEVDSSADAEIMSCLRAVRRAPNNCNLIIYTDCVYVCTGLHGRKQDRALFVQLRQAISARVGAVHFRWVKGHATDEYNIKADELAADGTRRCFRKLKEKRGLQEYVEQFSTKRKVVTVTSKQLAQHGPSGNLTGEWMEGPNGQKLNLAQDDRGIYSVIAALPGEDGSRGVPQNGATVIVEDDEGSGQEIEYVMISDDEEAPNVNSGSDMDLEEEEGAQEAKNTAISVDAISSADDEPSEEGESPASDVRDVVVGEKRKRA